MIFCAVKLAGGGPIVFLFLLAVKLQRLVYELGIFSAQQRAGRKGTNFIMGMADDTDLVDWVRFDQARASLGVRLFRHLGYLREDGAKAVTQIEDAMRSGDAVAMVNPADLLRAEALQIGAIGVAALAEDIEDQARDCIEYRQTPDNIIEAVVKLRDAFERTVALIDGETNPLMARHPILQTKSAAFASR
jgi:hypothetical protein